MADTIEDYVRNKKLDELDSNFNALADTFTKNNKTYLIDQKNLTYLIGLVTLNADSEIAVIENGVMSLVMHTALQLSDLLTDAQTHLTSIEVSRFNKRVALNALTEHEAIQDFDVSLP